ncbi:DEAD/DEAH box helicase family protein [Enterococcus hermanniensis]|uniref:Competence protein ComFA n=1 Tax=Enterococcus hermanniensis TaxID=249189 RepID=A0A1L8TP03_9ENTE|nr:DEAD/DEAH box helicase family protein [Enterococcus hermanniensis]OJG45852.1 hypothetical protein RV04_GL001618 [Enterococcus hermanniensis]
MSILGQRLLLTEWQTFYPHMDLTKAEKIPAMVKKEEQWLCQRWGSLSKEKVPAGFYYCPYCIDLGRISSQKFLYYFLPNKQQSRDVTLQWVGKLSPAQAKISQELVADQVKAKTFLLWAVTGAGKTELLFALIKNTLAKGEHVAIASPRVDVCNEIYLRFCQAFPDEEISLLHGQDRKERGSVFVICTIHQLFRYFDYFDLIIIDEVDAFPYEGNFFLQQAVNRALTKGGRLVYLSATPPKKIIQTAERCYYLPARYHRHPLPVPQLLFSWHLEQYLRAKKLPKQVLNKLFSLLQETDILLFCPNITLLLQLGSQLKVLMPEISLTTVFSQDQERLIKVENMRKGKYQLLLTTTILERGVTFENISVIVLQASHRIFTKAALVQISGRVDRKGVSRCGEVLFVTSEMTTSIKQAINEIQTNNRCALTEGLIDAL